MKTPTKLVAVSIASALFAVWSYFSAVMNASFAFSNGHEWRQVVALRWSYAALAGAALALVTGIAAAYRALEGRRRATRTRGDRES